MRKQRTKREKLIYQNVFVYDKGMGILSYIRIHLKNRDVKRKTRKKCTNTLYRNGYTKATNPFNLWSPPTSIDKY